MSESQTRAGSATNSQSSLFDHSEMDTGPGRRQLLHPIACEPCRQKKCKCDRVVPICSQCLGEPSKCSYPESAKRGLPLGYLTQLEKRLADTELALFEALATLRSLDHDETALVKASVKPGNASRRSKHARMEEWGRLPLRDGMTEDIRDWWNAKTENYTIHQPDEGRIQTQRNPISVSYSPASTSRIASNNVRASSVASVVEAPVSTGTPPNYQRNLHYGNDISRQPPPETVASREHTISEVNTEYPDLQILDARDGEKAAVLASEQSNLYF